MSTSQIILGNRVHFAPLAGIADPSCRILCRLFGAGPLMSEMVSAHATAVDIMGPLSDEVELLEQQQPLAVQFVGSDPELMAESARRAAALGASSINLNFACPARKIVRSGKGAAMMKTPDLALEIMKAARAAVEIPVTVKIRAGWTKDTINALEISQLAEEAGLAAVFLHPRTRAQGFGGESDWSLIKKVKEGVNIPVVGNGDIKTPDDAVRMLETTGCDAIMIGRGALGRPWLFSQIIARLRKECLLSTPAFDTNPVPDLTGIGEPPEFDVDRLAQGIPDELGRLVHLHLALALHCREELKVARQIRKHLIWYSRGMAHSHVFRANIHTAVDRQSLTHLIDGFFTGS